jgi:hypothetical protein
MAEFVVFEIVEKEIFSSGQSGFGSHIMVASQPKR